MRRISFQHRESVSDSLSYDRCDALGTLAVGPLRTFTKGIRLGVPPAFGREGAFVASCFVTELGGVAVLFETVAKVVVVRQSPYGTHDRAHHRTSGNIPLLALVPFRLMQWLVVCGVAARRVPIGSAAALVVAVRTGVHVPLVLKHTNGLSVKLPPYFHIQWAQLRVATALPSGILHVFDHDVVSSIRNGRDKASDGALDDHRMHFHCPREWWYHHHLPSRD